MADKNQDDLRKMAMEVMAMIRESLGQDGSKVQGQVQGRDQGAGQTQAASGSTSGSAVQARAAAGATVHQTMVAATTSRSIVQQNMSRAFPGLFKSRSKKHTAGKNVQVPFFLLDGTTEKTPKPSVEMVLLQAGLGKRSISIPENASHKEITEILCAAYPKMQDLEGAWMVHKAVGGSGQRRLNLVSPDEAGYTGAGLHRAWGGKSCLYIMPIQHKLNTAPLPFDAPEFAGMPTAKCTTCNLHVPLQLLSLHVETCVVAEEDITVPNTTNVKICCPICQQWIDNELIEVHASTCGDSHPDAPDITEQDELYECHPDELSVSDDRGSRTERSERPLRPKDLNDIIKGLEANVDDSTTFSIVVTREGLVDRGLKQWQRQKKATPRNPLRVTFLGEAGIDNGALRIEFLTEMLAGLESRFFEGESCGKAPKYSITDMDNKNFKTIGEIFAVSIVQGGPPPNFLMQWCYNYIATGEMNFSDVTEDSVADVELRGLLQQIHAADLPGLLELADHIISCGYTGLITEEKKEDIVRAVVLHGTLRLCPILLQLSSGMALFGLMEAVRQEKELCQPLFVQELCTTIDADFLVQSLMPMFSDRGTSKRQRECDVVNFLQDYIQELEDQERAERCDVGQFCQWITGQKHLPITSSQREDFKIILEFEHDCHARYGHHQICYPVVNACARAITLPVGHLNTAEKFREVMDKAFMFGGEFGRS